MNSVNICTYREGGRQKATDDAKVELREIQPQTDILGRNRKFFAQKILGVFHNDLVKSINPYVLIAHIQALCLCPGTSKRILMQ